MIYFFIICTILAVAIKCNYYNYYGLDDGGYGYYDYYSYGGWDPWGLLGGLRQVPQMEGPPMHMPPPFAPPGVGGSKYPGPSGPMPGAGGPMPGNPTSPLEPLPGEGQQGPEGEGTGDRLCQPGEKKHHEWTKYDWVECICQNDGKTLDCQDTVSGIQWEVGGPEKYFKQGIWYNRSFDIEWPGKPDLHVDCVAEDAQYSHMLHIFVCKLIPKSPGMQCSPGENFEDWEIYPPHLRVCVYCQCEPEQKVNCKLDFCHRDDPLRYCTIKQDPFTFEFNRAADASCHCESPDAPPSCILQNMVSGIAG